MRVKISTPERIINALSNVEYKKTDSSIDRDVKDFTAIREITLPIEQRLYFLEKQVSSLYETLEKGEKLEREWLKRTLDDHFNEEKVKAQEEFVKKVIADRERKDTTTEA